jgi:hypothetical protein
MTADVLRRKRADLLARIAFIDELLAEMGLAEDSPPEPAKPPAVKDGRASAPKVARPATLPGPGKKLAPGDVAVLLADGPMVLGALAAATDVSSPTVRKLLEAHPQWFRKTDPDNRLSPWELTETGRLELDS